MPSVLLHDERLAGNTPKWSDTICFTVEEGDSLLRVLSWIVHVRQTYGRIDELSILCHGYVDPVLHVGGLGLQLSKDDVKLHNVHQWSAIKGMVDRIVVYACQTAAANILPQGGNGRELCRRLALETGAGVMAATRDQLYGKSVNPLNWRRIQFGDWEGPVYLFLPDGTISNVTPWAGAT